MIRTGNRKLMRKLNTNLVLDQIRNADGISQVAIQHATSLSAGTVTRIVQDLTEKDFIRVIGPVKSAMGRRPIMIKLNQEARFTIGAGMLADRTQIAILDLAGNIKAQIEFPTRATAGPEAVLQKFSQHVEELITKTKIPRDRIIGVGIGFEGLVDKSAGQLILSVRLGWSDVPVQKLVGDQLGLKTWVDTEAAMIALGEFRYGAGVKKNHIIYMDIDAGIGAVELFKGSVRHGSHSMAGELGHAPFVRNGKVCKCGKQGCLETVASGWAIVERARMIRGEGMNTSISDQVNSPIIAEAVEAVFDAARAGDVFAREILDEAIEYLGMAVATIIQYADPELVVLAGCVTDHSDGMLLMRIRNFVREHIIQQHRSIEIETSVLGETAIMVGSGALVCEETFYLPITA